MILMTNDDRGGEGRVNAKNLMTLYVNVVRQRAHSCHFIPIASNEGLTKSDKCERPFTNIFDLFKSCDKNNFSCTDWLSNNNIKSIVCLRL